jgi:hypothetical protein
MKDAIGAATILAALGLLASAAAAELKITDVKAYAYLEHAGKLSDDLVGGHPLENAPRGGAPGGDTATAVLIDFTFEGDKNSSPKYATATVDLTQINHAGERVTHKAFTNFIFGAEGVEHKAVFLEDRRACPSPSRSMRVTRPSRRSSTSIVNRRARPTSQFTRPLCILRPLPHCGEVG